tara:strand:- start:109 stop:318 length:210 start_codon:yes stop_codon:yes gene_type:complete
MDKQYLKNVWNSVWEEGLTEQEVQKLYFEKLEKELKGEDRYMLKMLKYEMKIKEEFKDGVVSYLSNKND